MSTTAKIHSIETCGTVDGPGIRCVVFFQGCFLRCKYCHNPDTFNINAGTEMTVDELIEEIKKYKSYFKHSGGGVTTSGGESLIQWEFVSELFQKLKKLGINTAVDTSGYQPLEETKHVFENTDLVLLDIKSFNPTVYKGLTGVELQPTIDTANYLNEKNIDVWIRYVVVPGITDDLDDVRELSKFISTLNNVKRIDVLPFHKMGEFKWETLNMKYQLSDTQPPTQQSIEEIKSILIK
jgi:pyruvate formate lyase activating enzyme